MKKLIDFAKKIVRNDKVSNVFFYLYDRWRDEYMYEDIEQYGKVLVSNINKEVCQCSFLEATTRVFGFVIKINGGELYLFAKKKESGIVLAAKVIKDVSVTLTKEGGKFLSYIYAHGILEDDLGTDIVSANLNGAELKNGLTGTYNGKDVIFYIYMSDFGHTTGVVVYKDDEEANEYGKKLVEAKPHTF